MHFKKIRFIITAIYRILINQIQITIRNNFIILLSLAHIIFCVVVMRKYTVPIACENNMIKTNRGTVNYE